MAANERDKMAFGAGAHHLAEARQFDAHYGADRFRRDVPEGGTCSSSG
jgi:hypothetical protein